MSDEVGNAWEWLKRKVREQEDEIDRLRAECEGLRELCKDLLDVLPDGDWSFTKQRIRDALVDAAWPSGETK